MSALGENLAELKRGDIDLRTNEDLVDLRDLILDVQRRNDRIIQLLILVVVLQVAFLILVFVLP